MSQIRGRYHKKPSPLEPFLGEDSGRAESLARRDRLLRPCSQWREVVLWFGPCATEQLSLIQILAAIADQDAGTAKLSLVEGPGLGLGCYNPRQLFEFYGSRAALPRRRIELYKRAWRLYCGADPVPLCRFAKRHLASAPALAAALVRQLQEFPSIRNGLSTIEEALLRGLQYPTTVVEAVARVLVAEGDGLVGDLMLFETLWRFLSCGAPLVEAVGDSLRNVDSWQALCRLPVQLTSTGRAVLAARADNVALNGIDRWIGGVHLKGNSVGWRWDSGGNLLRRAAN